MSAASTIFANDSEAQLPAGGYFGDLGRDVALEEQVMVPSAVKARDEDLDVAFWNIEWFNKNVEAKIRGVARFVADMNLDVWTLEETSPAATEKLVKLLYDAYGLDFDFDASEPDAPNAKQSTTVMWNRKTVTGGKRAWPEEIDRVLHLSSQDDLQPLEDLEEAIHGKIFDRYPGLFHLASRQHAELDFFLVPLHLKAMDEGKLRRELASRVLVAAVNKMIKDGADADWLLGGDMNAPLSSGDFDRLSDADWVAASQADADAGAISYIKGPKSLIDHIYLSPNMAKSLAGGDLNERFVIVAAEKEIPKYVDSISDHRPVMLRLHAGVDTEEGVVARALAVPEWLRPAKRRMQASDPT